MLSLHKFFELFKAIFALVYIASTMGLLANLLIPYPRLEDADEISSSFLFSWLALYLLTLFFLVLRPGAVLKKWNILFISILAIVLVSIVSFLWSSDAVNTISYAGVLALNFLFCVWLVNEYPIPRVVTIIYRAIFIMVACSVVLYVMGYSGVLYYDPHGRETLLGTQPLRGLFNHKITAGLYAVFGFLLCMSLKRGVGRIAGCTMFAIFSILSGSSAAIGLLVIGVVIYSCIKSMLYYRFSLGVFIAIVLLVPLTAVLTFILAGEQLLSLLGRDPTLTGRTLLWGWGIEVALQNILLGWGYQGYMGTEHAADYAQTIPQFVNYNVPHFHNAYIQIFVELGILGLMLYLAVYFVVLARLYILSSKTAFNFNCYAKFDSFLPLLASLTLLLVSSFFINTFLQYNDFSTLLFFVSAVVVTREFVAKFTYCE
ncbi:MAG: O-antigen ligase family protein [Pseudomonadota bacterium]